MLTMKPQAAGKFRGYKQLEIAGTVEVSSLFVGAFARLTQGSPQSSVTVKHHFQ